MRKTIILILTFVIVLTGCQNNTKVVKPVPDIYYLSVNGMDLVRVPYKGNLAHEEDAVQEVLTALREPQESIEGISPFVKEVNVEAFELADIRLNLYFNQEYLKLNEVEEVLLRSSLVQSLTKIEGIEMVSFYVENEPFTDASGNRYGYMRAEDFVQNVGSALNSYQKAELTLYFANEAGDALLKETQTVRHNSNSPLEKVVLERLMRAPTQSGHRQTISPDSKLLGVTVKEDICYVNFDEGIQQVTEDVKPDILLYSIVNSLVANKIAAQVQISINGESNVKLLESISLEQPFEANWDLEVKGH